MKCNTQKKKEKKKKIRKSKALKENESVFCPVPDRLNEKKKQMVKKLFSCPVAECLKEATKKIDRQKNIKVAKSEKLFPVKEVTVKSTITYGFNAEFCDYLRMTQARFCTFYEARLAEGQLIIE